MSALLTVDEQPIGSAALARTDAGDIYLTARHVVEFCLPNVPGALAPCPNLALLNASELDRPFAKPRSPWYVGYQQGQADTAVVVHGPVPDVWKALAEASAKSRAAGLRPPFHCAFFSALAPGPNSDRAISSRNLRLRLSGIRAQKDLIGRLGPAGLRGIAQSLVALRQPVDGPLVASSPGDYLNAAEELLAVQDPLAQAVTQSRRNFRSWPGVALVLSQVDDVQVQPDGGWRSVCDGWLGASGGGLFDRDLTLIGVTQRVDGVLGSLFRHQASVGYLYHSPL